MGFWNWLILILAVLLGIVIGMFINAFRIKSSVIGTLMLVKQDDGSPYMFVELDRPLKAIKFGKMAIMRVSQK